MYRTREYRIDVRKRSIKRKKRIVLKRDHSDWYPHDGQYSKGKIHCGCNLCKYGRKYGIPTVRREREDEKFKLEKKDYESNKDF